MTVSLRRERVLLAVNDANLAALRHLVGIWVEVDVDPSIVRVYISAKALQLDLFEVLTGQDIDDLSIGLNHIKIGCNFNGVSINHLVYADDTVLLAPAPSALQKLVDFCAKYASKNDIFYNLKKR